MHLMEGEREPEGHLWGQVIKIMKFVSIVVLFKEPGENAGNPAEIMADACGKSLNNFPFLASVVHNSSRNKTP